MDGNKFLAYTRPMFWVRGLIILMMLFPWMALAAPARPACAPPLAEEPPLTRDYKILVAKKEIELYGAKYYESAQRLKGRAYWDEGRQGFAIPHGDGIATVPSTFLEGLASHIKKAFANKYVDAVIYQDMGHAHILLPDQEWQDIKQLHPVGAVRIEKALQSSRLQVLYHTIEMVQIKEGDFAKGKMPQDPWKLWRYFTRNLLGTFDTQNSLAVRWAGPDAIYNTVRSIEGMTEITTLYFSANKGACFPYTENDQPRFFDITFESIPYESGN